MPPVTFGVELEFLIYDGDKGSSDKACGIVDHQLVEDSWAADPTGDEYQRCKPEAQSTNHVRKTLKKKDFKVAADGMEYEEDYKAWSVGNDFTVINGSDDEEERWLNIELASPIFTSDHANAATTEITKICEAMKQEYECHVNSTCGVHVHVGYGNGVALPKDTLKNLFAILWVFEKRITELHPPHRKNGFCYDLRHHSKLGSLSSSATTANLLDMLFNAKTTDDLLDLFGKAKSTSIYMAYKVDRMKTTSQEHSQKTIEFRQHAGSLDPKAINHWVQLCVGLVKYAEKADAKELKAFLLKHDKEGTIQDLLKEAGLDEQAEYYRKSPTARNVL